MRRQTDQTSGCSFCGTARARVQVLVEGPGVRICNECVDICNEIIADARQDAGPETPPAPPVDAPPSLAAEQCSFCDRRGSEVGSLRPVPNVFVCDECVDNVISSR